MVKYIKQEMPDMTGKGETRAYYRIKSVGNIDTREFIRLVSQAGGGLSEGSVSHVLYQMTSKLADLLGDIQGNPWRAQRQGDGLARRGRGETQREKY